MQWIIFGFYHIMPELDWFNSLFGVTSVSLHHGQLCDTGCTVQNKGKFPLLGGFCPMTLKPHLLKGRPIF